jgi:hypothetical protein
MSGWILRYCVNIYAHLLWTRTHESFCTNISELSLFDSVSFDYSSDASTYGPVGSGAFGFHPFDAPSSRFICIFQIMMISNATLFQLWVSCSSEWCVHSPNHGSPCCVPFFYPTDCASLTIELSFSARRCPWVEWEGIF